MPFSTLHALWALRDDRALTATEQRIAVMLVAFSDETGKCWPSISKIAEAARTSRSAVQRALKLLESGSGPIRLTVTRGRVSEHGDADPNLYQLSVAGGWPHTDPTPHHTDPTVAPPVPDGWPHTDPGVAPYRHSKKTKKKTEKEDTEESAARAVFEHWSSALFSKVNPKREPKPSRARMDKIRARLSEDYSIEDLKLVIDNVAATPFMLGENDRGLPYIEPKTIFANGEKVETWLAKKPPKSDGRVQSGASDERVSQWEHRGRNRLPPPRQPDSGYSPSAHARDASND